MGAVSVAVLCRVAVPTGIASALRNPHDKRMREHLLSSAGSSFAWAKESDAGADNLIPIEIALKIVHAIKRNERFAAYIVLPLHPDTEGFTR